MTRAPVLHLSGPLLVGPDEVRDEAWVLAGRLTFTAPASARDVQRVDGVVLPGLVDAHCHVGLDAHGAVDRDTAERQAAADRDAGALLLRDAGSAADTRWIDEREDLPRLVRAGRHIARPRRYLKNFAEEVEPADLAAEARRQAARGDGWVKLVGDWIDRDRGELAPCWPGDALLAAVRAAHEAGARVTAHCFGAQCLPDLLAAGVDGIEHGTGLGPAEIETCAARGVAVVPTLLNTDTFPEIAAGAAAKFPRYAEQMLALHARRLQTVRDAYEAGVPLYAGTDAGGSLAHGRLAEEVAQLAAAGLPALAALGAASWQARRWLGHDGLLEGASADLVVLPADPREDLAALTAPVVVLRGRVAA